MKTKKAARRPALDRSVDQRLSARLACGPEIACRLLGPGSLDCWALRVQNLSGGGISVLLDRVVPTGKVLTVEIYNHARRTHCRRQIRVIYAVQLPGGGLLMGGAFAPLLTEQELATLKPEGESPSFSKPEGERSEPSRVPL